MFKTASITKYGCDKCETGILLCFQVLVAMTQCLALGAMEVVATWRGVSLGPMLSLPKLTNALTCSLSWRGDLKGLDVTGNHSVFSSLPSFMSRYWLDLQTRNITTLIVVILHFNLSSNDLGCQPAWTDNSHPRLWWKWVRSRLVVWWHMHLIIHGCGGGGGVTTPHLIGGKRFFAWAAFFWKPPWNL